MEYPLLDISVTGKNIARLRKKGMTVRALRISVLLTVSMNDIIVETVQSQHVN